MLKREIFKRYILLLFGLFVLAFGIALTKRADLGVAPISSVVNVISEKLTFFSFGTWFIIWNGVLILVQILIRGKKFGITGLLQIPVAVVFGLFNDIGITLSGFVPVFGYASRLIIDVSGVIIIALGVSLTVIANVAMNPPEGFVKTLSEKLNISFGYTKIGFDCSCVLISVILSLILFDLSIIGTREGTVIAAVFTGALVKLFSHLFKKPLDSLLK